MALLEVTDVGVRFGGVVALSGLSFTIDEGQICALIGPNGAGKTTLFNVVSRLYEPNTGTVRFADVDLLGLPPHRIAPLGIARTFQNLALVPGLSVLDNVVVGSHSRTTGGFWAAALWFPQRSQERRVTARALEVLRSLHLDHLANRPCAGLPYGTLKRIEIARSLMAEPRLLLLDEPASGLTHGEVDELGDVIKRLRDDHSLTVLLVEHHMGMVMGISDKVVVMELGQKIAEGAPAQVQSDPRVISAYLRRTGSGGLMALLEVSGLTAGYGIVQVLFGLDFTVDTGEAVVILGANGAGKTTTLRGICGMVDAAGEVRLDGKPMRGSRPDQLLKAGVAHVPQGRGTIVDLTVDENLRVGAFTREGSDVDADIARWFEVFPRLAERRDQPAGSMSGGEQQMLAIARAFMSRPRLVLLDEPSLGLAPIVTREVFDQVGRLVSETGTAVLLVEQNANLALAFASRAYVLEAGRIVSAGSAAELQGDESIRKAYLGS